MRDDRWLAISLSAALATVLLGGMIVVWPFDRETRSVHDQIATLQRLVGDGERESRQLYRLARDLDQAMSRADAVKTIPRAPDVVQLVEHLAHSVDLRTAASLTFAAGVAIPDTSAGGPTRQVLPVLIDLRGSYASVLDVVRGVERHEDLMRVASLRIDADRGADGAGAPMVRATIGLQIVFDPAAAGMGS